MSIFVSVPSGGIINLADLDVSDIYEGTTVAALQTGTVYQLVTSNATVDHIDIEAVRGNATLRWVKQVTGAPIFIPSYDQYASPDGEENADGSITAPKKYLYDAVADVITHGGGTVHFVDNTEVGGPVADQGLWLRNDGLSIDVPGWLDLNNSPLQLIGNGNASGGRVFERPGAARVIGGGLNATGDYTKPALWIASSEVPILVQGAVFGYQYGAASPVRLGWDYVRKTDGTLENLTVTNGNRAAGSTVFTVDLSTASAWTIQSASRDANDNVTLVLTRPLSVGMTPWTPGSIVRVVTADSDFPSVDAVVTEQSDYLPINQVTTVSVTYVQAGATLPNQPLTGTVVSHGCAVHDLIAMTSTHAQFAISCQYRVTARTVDTITVRDYYGYGSRSASTGDVANPGTVVKQNRGRQIASAVTMSLSSVYGQVSTTDTPHFGPAIDLGGTSAGLLNLNEVYIKGGLRWQWWLESLDNVDQDRTSCALLADNGSIGSANSASFAAYNCQSEDGSVRWYSGVGLESDINVNKWLQDSAGNCFPTVSALNTTNSNPFSSITLDGIKCADSTTPAVFIDSGFDQSRVTIGQVYSSAVPPVSGSGMTGPYGLRTATWTTNALGVASPWKLQWNTVWSGGLSTPHKNVNWAMGPVSARLANQFPALSLWEAAASFPAGITVTQDGAGPDASNTAYKIVNANAGRTGFTIGGYPFGTWDNGDGIVFGAWIKMPGDGELDVQDYSGGTSFDGAAVVNLTRYIGTGGWQWVCLAKRLQTTGGFAGKFFISADVPAGTSYIYAPILLRSIAGAMTDDEFYEFGRNAKHQPLYLPAGYTGTMEGQKFIAHGGVGVATGITKVVGGGSGQLTLTGTGTVYEPRYDADGTTILGWVALLQATVNP